MEMALATARTAVSMWRTKWIGTTRSGNICNLRRLTFATSTTNRCNDIISGKRQYCKSQGKDVNPQETSSTANISAPTYKHSPTLWDKRILVWTKKYPSIDQVPDYVSRETMDKARNKARIYTNLLMGVATILACVAMIISGKRAAKRGESVQQMNIEWHKKQ